MTARELIAVLKKLPPDLDVVMWDVEADEWLPVAEAILEDGTSHIALDTTAHEWVTGVPDDEDG